MANADRPKADDLDWMQFTGSMPREGVVRVRGSKKAELDARVRKALAGARQPA